MPNVCVCERCAELFRFRYRQIVVEVDFTRNPKELDWDGGAHFGQAFAVYILWK